MQILLEQSARLLQHKPTEFQRYLSNKINLGPNWWALRVPGVLGKLLVCCEQEKANQLS
jgi:hypothetical protein